MDEEMGNEHSEGFEPLIQAEGDVTMTQAGSLAVVAGGNAEIHQGGAGFLVVGGDASIDQGGAGTMLAGGSVTITQGSVGQMATVEASVTDSRVGLLLALNADLERSEVMVTTQQAAAFGAIAGLVCFLLSRLFRRG